MQPKGKVGDIIIGKIKWNSNNKGIIEEIFTDETYKIQWSEGFAGTHSFSYIDFNYKIITGNANIIKVLYE